MLTWKMLCIPNQKICIGHPLFIRQHGGGIVYAEVDKISLTVKQASFWGVKHITRCNTVDCVKCYNGDMDKVLKNQ